MTSALTTILNIKIDRYQCLTSDTDEESVMPLSKAKKARKRKVPERLNDSWSGSDSDSVPTRLVSSTFGYRVKSKRYPPPGPKKK